MSSSKRKKQASKEKGARVIGAVFLIGIVIFAILTWNELSNNGITGKVFAYGGGILLFFFGIGYLKNHMSIPNESKKLKRIKKVYNSKPTHQIEN